VNYAARLTKLEQSLASNRQGSLTREEIDAAISRFCVDLKTMDPALYNGRTEEELAGGYRDLLRNAKGWEAKVYSNSSHADFML
jgi:hypothetical protein